MLDLRWWKRKNIDLYEAVYEYIDSVKKNQSYQSDKNLRNMKLYGNYDQATLGAYTNYKSFTDIAQRTQNRVTLNIIQSMVDTVTSKITKNKPKATFLTTEGNWDQQQRAKKLSQYVEGQFHNLDLYELGTTVFKDACIFGTGVLKIYHDEKANIKAERVLIDEIIVDEIEGHNGKPRQLHQTKFVHKDVLTDMFPDCAVSIEEAFTDDNLDWGSRTENRSMIRVIESWHLPSGPDAKDGRHAITIKNKTLYSEEYTKDYFPFLFLHWNPKLIGFYGQGLAEQLMGLQLEINKILRTIQVSMHLTSIPKVFIEMGSKVNVSHLNNQIGGMIHYTGTKPSYESVGAIPGELFSHLDRLYQRAFEIAGVSQLSATSLKPGGLDSGKALREFSDIESERFHEVSTRYQDFYLDAARLIICMSKELYEKGVEDLKVQAKGEDFISTIKWKDVDLEEDAYLMQLYPTNALSSHPSGRLADIQDLLNAGLLSREDALRLLDFPDLKAAMSEVNAPIENIESTITYMIEKDKYLPPEPFQDLQLGIKKMQENYLKFRTQGMPDSKLQLLRDWIDDAQAMLERSAQEQMDAQPPAGIPNGQ